MLDFGNYMCRLYKTLNQKHTISIHRAMCTAQHNIGHDWQEGDTVFVIGLDGETSECELYTNTRRGGLYFLHDDYYKNDEAGPLRPWEFSLAKYEDDSKRRAAVEYTRRKFNKLRVGA